MPQARAMVVAAMTEMKRVLRWVCSAGGGGCMVGIGRVGRAFVCFSKLMEE